MEAVPPSLPVELPLLWVKLCPPKDVEALIPVPVNMIFFRYRTFADDEVKMTSLG